MSLQTCDIPYLQLPQDVSVQVHLRIAALVGFGGRTFDPFEL